MENEFFNQVQADARAYIKTRTLLGKLRIIGGISRVLGLFLLVLTLVLLILAIIYRKKLFINPFVGLLSNIFFEEEGRKIEEERLRKEAEDD